MTEGTQQEPRCEVKRCRACGLEKPRSEFYAHRTTADRLGIYCKPCQAERSRESRLRNLGHYQQRNRELRRKQRARLSEDERRWLKLWSRYRLTKERYEFILARQGGGCAGCGSNGPLHVDHDHSCCPSPGQSCGDCVRGLLCKGCNVAIGFAEENPDALVRLATYVTHPPIGAGSDRQRPKLFKPETKACVVCSKPYESYRRDAKYCSAKCARTGNRAKNQQRLTSRTCTFPGCDRNWHANWQGQDLCRTHYKQQSDKNSWAWRKSKRRRRPMQIETLF